MKIKSFLWATAFAITLISCSKENDNNIENNSTTEKEIYRFSSEKEMQEKITEIEAFRNNQEQQILQKILHRNNLSAPTAIDIQNASKNQLLKIDDAKVLEDVTFYHQEKLKAIYAERAYFGFTSIQSIADEINFNKIINPEKSEKLITENYNSLKISQLMTIPTFGNKISLVLNKKGLLVLNKEIINYNNITSANKSTPSILKEGVLADNGSYQITWHAGVDGPNNRYTQFGSFVNGALFPSWFHKSNNSFAWFSVGLSKSPLPFPDAGSYGSIVRNQNYGNGPYFVNEGFVSGTFLTIYNGQWITVSGSANFPL